MGREGEGREVGRGEGKEGSIEEGGRREDGGVWVLV